jgi:hypothetical protein
MDLPSIPAINYVFPSTDCFADSEVATLKSQRLPGIVITYLKLAEFWDKAERLQQSRQPALGKEGTGKKSKRRTKKRKLHSIPTEHLSPDREREFRETEREVEGRMAVDDSGFQGQTRGV